MSSAVGTSFSWKVEVADLVNCKRLFLDLQTSAILTGAQVVLRATQVVTGYTLLYVNVY
jgi:hypothetical protein